MTSSELIHSLDFDSLLFRLSKGESISDEEIKSLSDFVKRTTSEQREKRSLEELFAAVTFVKKYDDPALSHLLLKTLNVHDPLIVSLAIEVLVLKWNKFEDIEEQLLAFALGVPYDQDGDIRDSAVSAITHTLLHRLHPTEDSRLRLISTLESLLEDTDDDFLKDTLQESLDKVAEAEKVYSKKLA